MSQVSAPSKAQELELAAQVSEFYGNPLGFVLFAFPWGELGPLENFNGPRPKQERFLIDLGDEIKARKFDGVTPVLPICMSISSGHGEGKSALIGMLSQFLMATRDGLLGTVTANTGLQLSTKTWAAIQTWNNRSICKHWFEINAERFYRIGRKHDWFMSPQSCAEENSEAFAGQHNVQSSSVYLFDEDSNVSDKIHEVAQGGLTDGESMFFTFGNPTRREGAFYQINFGVKRDFWNKFTLGPTRNTENPAGTRIWDAHDSPYSNKQLQQEWLTEHGFDSDFYRVRVRGLPPMAGDTQFIPADLISAAQRLSPRYMMDEPLIVGVDLSWGGNDYTCIRFRRGSDARSIPPIKIPGAQTKDDAITVAKLADIRLQLSTKTWAAIQTWNNRSICKHWFEINAERFYRIGRKHDWFMSPQSCAEENSEAFAGQHNVQSSSVYLFDEDSNVSDKIHEVAQGGLTDGESMFFTFGNPTRREGAFYQINFGVKRDFWNKFTLGPTRNTENPAGTRIWDAHDSPYSNKQLQQEWLTEHGFDSDFYRVRVRGLPPMAGDTQFIPADLISAAQRLSPRYMMDEPLIVGVDLSWGGNDYTCIRFRRGSDARSIPPIKIPGAQTKDDAITVAKLADIMTREWNGRKVDMVFIDSAGTCGNICRRLRELNHTNITEINFGGFSPDPKYKLMRSYMWGQVKNALPYLAIDKSPDLEADLGAPGYKLTKDTEILLEPKQDVIKRLGHSTDDADALALTYAIPVKSQQAKDEQRKRQQQARGQIGAWT